MVALKVHCVFKCHDVLMALLIPFALTPGHLRFVMKVNETLKGFAEMKRHSKIFHFLLFLCAGPPLINGKAPEDGHQKQNEQRQTEEALNDSQVRHRHNKTRDWRRRERGDITEHAEVIMFHFIVLCFPHGTFHS